MKNYRRWMLFWCLLVGIGAILGGACMLADPSGRMLGMDAMLPFFQVLPLSETLYQNFVFPGIALIAINGLTQLTAAALILRRKPSARRMGIACGIVLMLWICIQFYIFPFNFMSTIYFVFGALQCLSGILWARQERRA